MPFKFCVVKYEPLPYLESVPVRRPVGLEQDRGPLGAGHQRVRRHLPAAQAIAQPAAAAARQGVPFFFFLVSQFDNDKISGKASPYFYKVVGAPGGLLHVEAVEELVDGVESRLGVHLPGALSRVRVLAVGTGGRGSYVACCKHYFCLNSKNIQV